jgi:hypothetical protein
MSRQAEAERERRARIISADGEYQASKRLAAAANVMARDPAALQLRLLQTVVEVAAEKNSTLVMPVPVELLRFFERYAPAPTPPATPPPPLEDTGDAELAAAEAAAEVGGPDAPAIADAPLPEIATAPVPELDESAIPPPPKATGSEAPSTPDGAAGAPGGPAAAQDGPAAPEGPAGAPDGTAPPARP